MNIRISFGDSYKFVNLTSIDLLVGTIHITNISLIYSKSYPYPMDVSDFVNSE